MDGVFFDPIGLMRFTPTKKYLSLGPIDYFKNNPEDSNSLTFNKIASFMKIVMRPYGWERKKDSTK